MPPRMRAGQGIPVARSAEPGEDWSWCYADSVGFVLSPAGRTIVNARRVATTPPIPCVQRVKGPRHGLRFGSSKPVRSCNPRLGRFDSGAAPSSRIRLPDGVRGARCPTFGLQDDAARDRPEPPRKVADCGENVARSRVVGVGQSKGRQARAHSRMRRSRSRDRCISRCRVQEALERAVSDYGQDG